LSLNLQLLNLFFGMCRGTHGLPLTLHNLGYIPELVEASFNNSEDRPVAPELIIASAQIHHTVILEWKSGANTEADQLQRYSRVIPADLITKAYVHRSKCETHDVAVIGRDEHRLTIPIGIANPGYPFPVLVTTPQGMEIIHNTFSSAPTDAAFRPLVINWDTLPTTFFPLDSDSALWEFAEHAIPYVLEDMVGGSPRILLDELGRRMVPLWSRMRPDYRGLLKTKIQEVMNHAAQSEFGTHLQRGTARGAIGAPHWDIINNPLVGAADKRQKAWKSMLKKHQALIDYYKNPVRQEMLELDEGEAV